MQGFCDEREALGTAGSQRGTSGGYRLRACVAVFLFGLCVCAVNALTIGDDAARQGLRITSWMPWATEYTSLAALLLSLPVPLLAEAYAARSHIAWKRVALLVAGAFPFSAFHIAIMSGLRHLVWGLAGRAYSPGLWSAWAYEFRKDAVAYVIVLAALAASRRWSPRRATRADPQVGAAVQLGDGRKTLLVGPETILAASSAGNYVELLFSDTSRRLIRATLASVESALAPHGFVRTHKRWVVRADAVVALDASGTGDYRLSLRGGPKAPLSRRYAPLLRTLREKLARDGSAAPAGRNRPASHRM